MIISRKSGESFILGDDIKISVLEIIGDKVKIGIEAPKTVKILRSEVIETEKSNIEAVMSEGPKNLEMLKNNLTVIGIGRGSGKSGK